MKNHHILAVALLPVLAIACSPAGAADKTPPARVSEVVAQGPFAGVCSVFDQAPAATPYDGRCDEVYLEDGRYRVSFPGRSMTWLETSRQGQWATGTLDGRPAVRYEVDRTAYEYSTLDLKTTLSVRAR